MTIPLFHVDAFADRPFTGNAAAVCLLPAWKEDRWLQSVAAEMNLSETAFLVERPDHYDLRWFTPKVEVDLCGHATLAPATFSGDKVWPAARKSASRPAAASSRPAAAATTSSLTSL